MLAPLPTRRIPVSEISLTGRVNGQEFESSLERDFLIRQAWDEDVDWFVTQPLTLRYEVATGIFIPYTPDVLTSYRARNRRPARRPLLCEIKYRDELDTDWRRLRRKFRAAQALCASRDWEWAVLDEHAIRDARLTNIKFLWRYAKAALYEEHVAPILGLTRELQRTTMREVLTRLASGNPSRMSEVAWTWWCLVARKRIAVDMSHIFGRETAFWFPTTSGEQA